MKMNVRLYLMPTLRMSGDIPPIHYAFRAWCWIMHRDFKFSPSPSNICKAEWENVSTVSLLFTPWTQTHALAEICHSRQHILSHTHSLFYFVTYSMHWKSFQITIADLTTRL